MEKKLTLVNEGKKLCGVCTGIGKYFDLDPIVVRLLFIFFTLLGGSGILAYICAALIMPPEEV